MITRIVKRIVAEKLKGWGLMPYGKDKVMVRAPSHLTRRRAKKELWIAMGSLPPSESQKEPQT